MSPAAKTPSRLVIMDEKSIESVPQRDTFSSSSPNMVGMSSGSKPSARIAMSAGIVKLLSSTTCGA